jgi:hypothetical protein
MMDLLALTTSLLQHQMVKFVLALLVANLVTGLLVAFNPKTPQEFRLGSIADWMTRALFLTIGSLTVQVLAYYATADYKALFEPFATACWVMTIGALVGKVIENLRELGFQAPAFLGDRPKPGVTVSP